MTDTLPTCPTQRSHWLCISYAFPPINRSGTHRTLGFVKHLDKLGWNATVVTVEPGDEPVDEELLARLPPTTEVIRTPWTDYVERVKALCRTCPPFRHAPESTGAAGGFDREPLGEAMLPRLRRGWRDWASQLLKTPDSRVGWIGPAFRQAMASIRRRRPEVIYSTSPYMTAHLIALRLSRRTRVPWVADFRDPWVDNPYRDLGFESLKRLDARLEHLVLGQAAHVVCSTPAMRDRLCQRLPFVADKSSVILNGFDPELFADVAPLRLAPPESFVMAHCGQFYGPRSPGPWFDALKRALVQSPQLAGKLRLLFLGPQSYNGRHLAELASAAGVGDQVCVLGPKSHRETLSYMAGSDALLLAVPAGPGGELQVPNKLYEYLAIRKPIIAAVPAHNPVVNILDDARAEAVVCSPDNAPALADAISALAMRRRCSVSNPWAGAARFDRAGRAEELLQVFRRVSKHGTRKHGQAGCVKESALGSLQHRAQAR